MDPFSQLILTISVVSFFTFQWLFHRVSPWVSVRISPGFLGLGDKQKVEWNSRTVSTFHALLVGIFCLYILFFDDAVNEDPVCHRARYGTICWSAEVNKGRMMYRGQLHGVGRT